MTERKQAGCWLWLVGAALAVLGADAASKSWARHNLAVPEFPLRLACGPKTEVCTPRQAVAHTLGPLSAEQTALVLAHTYVAEAVQPSELSAALYSEAWDGVEGIVVERPRGLTIPALRVKRDQHALIEGWLALVSPELSASERAAAAKERLATVSVAAELREALAARESRFGEPQASRVWSFGIRSAPPGPELALSEQFALFLAVRRVEWVPGLVRAVYAENPGAAWGLFETVEAPWRGTVLLLGAALSLLALGWLARAMGSRSRAACLAIGMLAGGTLGNALDRSLLGFVVDFVEIYWGWLRLPTFNVADVAVVGGISVLLFHGARRLWTARPP